MCGIVGWQLAPGVDLDPVALEDMANAVAHRGPDDRGYFVSPDGRVAFAHARLSIIDPTSGGHQPMVSADAGTRLAYVPHFVSEEREYYGERQSRGSDADPDKLRDRAAAHSLIHGHARRAGMGPNDAEMQQFARALFRLARQCGAHGLVDDSKQLFELARAASGEERARGLDFRAYRLLTGLAGWHRLGRLACDWDRRGWWPADE